MTLIAYHGDAGIKTAILAQLQAHHDADELVQGLYWEDGKGCAVGCTVHSSDHAKYEPMFGIPQMLARLEDCIFEGLPNDKAKEWPIRFMSAIEPGRDLSLVGWKFLHWILTDEKVNPGITHPLVKDAVAQVANVICAISKDEPIDRSAAESAAESAESAVNAAWSAAESARSAVNAAWSAAESARSARSAAGAAWSAAESARSAVSAACATWSAADAAWSAAESAAESAESAAESAESAADAARSATRSAAYILMADKLIELLEEVQ